MDNLLRLLIRLLVVPLGVVAGMIATMGVVIFGYWRVGDLLAGNDEVQAVALLETLVAASLLLMMIVLVMWAIAAIGILFAEAFAIRSWMFHTANGAVSAWIAAQLFPPYPDTPVPFDDTLVYVLGAGLAGGLVYWLVAGWSAGFWKPLGRALPPANPPVVPPSAEPPATSPAP
jgi:hypothetical protein